MKARMEQESDHAVANPGERPGGPLPYFLTKLRTENNCLETAPSPPYLRVWMTGPHTYLKVWIRHCHG